MVPLHSMFYILLLYSLLFSCFRSEPILPDDEGTKIFYLFLAFLRIMNVFRIYVEGLFFFHYDRIYDLPGEDTKIFYLFSVFLYITNVFTLIHWGSFFFQLRSYICQRKKVQKISADFWSYNVLRKFLHEFYLIVKGLLLFRDAHYDHRCYVIFGKILRLFLFLQCELLKLYPWSYITYIGT